MLFKDRRHCRLQTYGAGCLSRVSEPVTRFDQELADLAAVMTSALRRLDGIGLAAVQIGILKRLVILDVPASSQSEPPTPGEVAWLPRMPMALVNPRITAYGTELSSYDEGCLSVPQLYAPVIRPQVVKVEAQTLDGSPISAECGGLLGRCIQHELDHLDGTLFVDRLAPEVRQEVALELERMLRNGKRGGFSREVRV